MNERILPLREADIPSALAMLAESCRRVEVLYRPVTEQEFRARFLGAGRLCLGAYDGERLVGWIHGAWRENPQEPVYLTLVIVAPECRGQGVGAALVEALKEEARRLGRWRVVVSGGGPVPLTWLIPGTPGHDHNNAPGADEDGPGYRFLLGQGFLETAHEIAMYMPLGADWQDSALDERIAKLAEQGIRVGRWEPGLGGDYEGMCDRVGSDYWRHVLREELAAWRENRPNADPELWPDGRRPRGPRPLLTATREGKIIGFTGPVDLQESGRGWFTGICTDPEWSGRGIASALFGLLMREFVAEGAAFTSLFTGRDNPAQRIYHRAGLSVRARFCVLSCPLSESTKAGLCQE